MRFSWIRGLLLLVLAGCATRSEGLNNRNWSSLMAHARPPIMKDSREIQQDQEKDLLGWQTLLEERRKAEEARFAKQPKVTAVFVDLPIRDALMEISNQAAIPVVVDQTVAGNVTLNLQDVAFEIALRLIAFAGSYAYSFDGTAYYVGTVDPLNPGYSTLTATRVIPTYMPPKEVLAGVNKAYAPYLSFSEGINSITLTGPTSVLDRLEADIRLMDRAPVQVMIEVLVVETKYGGDYSIGLDYGRLEAEITKTMQWQDAARTLNQLDLITRLALTFDILSANNVAKVRSHPKVVTSNGTAAEIRSLVETYVSITRSNLATITADIEIIKTGTALKVTPHVTRNGEIELTLEPEVADVVGISESQDTRLPIVSRRAVKSTVRVRNGDVVIIGGLYEENIREVSRGLPFLKDVPIVNLFVSKQDGRSSETELLIFVSPKVIK